VAERFFDEGAGCSSSCTRLSADESTKHGDWRFATILRDIRYELQAAATDEGIVISLGERHSFPLDSIFGYLQPIHIARSLVQSVLQAPDVCNADGGGNATGRSRYCGSANGTKVRRRSSGCARKICW
jgi:ATP-dependent Lhr-like helicase